MREELLDGFAYDMWANTKWLEASAKMQNRTRVSQALQHVLEVQHYWRNRLDGLERERALETARLSGVSTGEIQRANGVWANFLPTADLDETIQWKTLDGSTTLLSAADVARHVINHGTYHRGHMRGIADAEGFQEFEETDWVYWLKQR